jgi:putative flippase GtrA
VKNFNIQDFIVKFLHFGVAGFIGMVIDFSVTYFFKEVVKAHKYLSNAMGFIISATANYFINRAWTFHNRDPQMLIQYSKFLVVAIIGLGINTGVLYYVHHYRKQNFYLAKLMATGITVFWNFTGNLLFTFS